MKSLFSKAKPPAEPKPEKKEEPKAEPPKVEHQRVNVFGGPPAGPPPKKKAPAADEPDTQGELGWVEQFEKENGPMVAVEMKPLDRLHRLCQTGNLEEIQKMKMNPLFEQKGAVGNVALHYAAHGGHTAIVGHLLSIGCKIDVVNDNGDTPLHLAVWKDHVDTAALLLQKGASTRIANKEGKFAADLSQSDEMTNKICGSAIVMAKDDDEGGDDNW